MIKKIISVVLICMFMVMISGCGEKKYINGYTYDTYGLLNQNYKKNPDIEYKLIIGNVVWSVILVETIIAPFYFIGFSIYEPVGLKDHNKPIGAI